MLNICYKSKIIYPAIKYGRSVLGKETGNFAYIIRIRVGRYRSWPAFGRPGIVAIIIGNWDDAELFQNAPVIEVKTKYLVKNSRPFYEDGYLNF